MTPRISFAIPFMNEEATLAELYEGITQSLEACLDLTPGETLSEAFEIVFVDDGSTDGSVKQVEQLIEKHSNVTLIQLRGNFGKSAALAAAFSRVRGDVVFTMDADLQDDPKEIPRFLEELDKGFDLVSGYKKKRNDPITKVLPSRVFNAMVRRVTGITLHDVNCGFKAYRRSVIDNVQLYGELHRFVPVLAHWRRFRIGEIAVLHHPRMHGVSKFGGGRFFRGLMDLFTVYFLLKYERRPAHFFGALGTLSTIAGVGICGYLAVIWIMGASIGHRPLLTLGVLLTVVGVQFLVMGLLAELLIYLTSQGRPPYVIRRVVDHESEVGDPPLSRRRTPRTAPAGASTASDG
ncbi:MAG: glycosyltransferase family 2 protein [Myxococcales bacterium]|nr:glycosyltransferase family 2 protein [Myxococcales bacterium]